MYRSKTGMRRLTPALKSASCLCGVLPLALTLATPDQALASCTIVGNAIETQCDSSAVIISPVDGAVTVTIDSETSALLDFMPSGSSTDPLDATLIITGNTTIERLDYPAVTIMTTRDNVNISVQAHEDVTLISHDTFGGIWLRNEGSGDMSVESAATVTAYGTEEDGITITTNGNAILTNSGTVTSTYYRGLYADASSPDGTTEVLSRIYNSGTVYSELAGIRSINYMGLANIENIGTVEATTRQGLVAWSNDGPTTIINSGSVIAQDDSAIVAWTETGDATATNSGSATSQDDIGHVDTGSGHHGMHAKVGTSGNAIATNTETGIIDAAQMGIWAQSAEGTVTVIQSGSVTAGTIGIDAGSDNGAVSVTNSGTITAQESGIIISGTSNSVTNSGTIIATGASAETIITGDFDTVIRNSGTISNSDASGNAIRFGAGDDTLIVETATSVIDGLVLAGGGEDTLVLEVNADGSFETSLIGASGQFRNFDIIEKTGAATLTLLTDPSAIADMTPWLVSEGRLAGESGHFGSAAIINNSTIIIEEDDDDALNNTISGTGDLIKTGAGGLSLNGIMTSFTGNTLVQQGNLAVNTDMQNSAVTISSGATLSGNGVVGNVLALGGARVAPGNSIGTLTVSGDYVQQAGSTYRVELDPITGASDLIAATGAATIENGATLEAITYTSGSYTPGTVFHILTAAGGVTGTYELVGAPAISTFYGLLPSYDAHNVYLTVARSLTFADAALTPNQQAVGAALDQIAEAAEPVASLLGLASLAEARDAFDQLSGEVHATTANTIATAGFSMIGAAAERARTADDRCGNQQSESAPNSPATACQNGTTAWIAGSGQWQSRDADGNAAGSDFDVAGVSFGLDKTLDAGWLVGVSAGYNAGSLALDDARGASDTDNYGLGLYAGRQIGALGVRLGASYMYSDITTSRAIAFGGFGDRLEADYDASTLLAFGELGYRIEASSETVIEPFSALALARVKTSSFAENGGGAALNGGDETHEIAVFTAGLRASRSVKIGSAPLALSGMIGWQHSTGDCDATAALSFDGGQPFTVRGDEAGADALVLEFGVATEIAPNLTVGLAYNGQFGDGVQDQGLRGRLGWSF